VAKRMMNLYWALMGVVYYWVHLFSDIVEQWHLLKFGWQNMLAHMPLSYFGHPPNLYMEPLA